VTAFVCVLSLCAVFAASSSVVPARAACTPKRKLFLDHGVLSYAYANCGVQDLDQRRTADADGLGGLALNGHMFCVPTSTMDWLTYLAARGYLSAPVVKDWTQPANFNAMSLWINLLASLMGTDPAKGTDEDGLQNGLSHWLGAFGFLGKHYKGFPFVRKSFQTGDRYDADPANMALAAIGGDLVLVHEGFYDGLDRKGGHVVALAEAHGAVFGPTGLIGVRDPNRPGSDDHVQAAYSTDEWKLVRTVFNGSETRWSIDTDFSRLFDGYTTIEPEYFVSDPAGSIVLDRPLNFAKRADQRQRPRFFKVPGGRVRDVAIAPEGTKHPYLRDGSNAVWQIDTLTGRSSRLAGGPARASSLTFGGPDMTLFVAGVHGLLALDRFGHRLAATSPAHPLDALAFDDHANRLVGLSLAARRLYYFSPTLQAEGSQRLPKAALRGSGHISLAISRQGRSLIHRDGQSTITISGENPGAFHPIAVGGLRDPQGLTVDDNGHMFVADRGRIVDLLPNGRRAPRSPFTGMPARRFLHVARSFSNVPPETVLDYLPPEFLDSTP